MEPIHIKEDTAKPENRTNLALLAILQIDEIHTYFLRELRLPPDSLVCPSPNVITEEFTNCGRPDFEIRDTRENPIGYIEVELGRENNAQVTRYRSQINCPVRSIVGKASYTPSDLSLEEIRERALSVAPKYLHMQQSVSLKLFCDLVKWYVIDGNYRPSNARADLSDKMLQSRLVQLILSHFGEENILTAGTAVVPGHIKLDTVGENGFSLRVASTETGPNGVSLMNRSGGQEVIMFPSLAKLLKYFPHRQEASRAYARIIERLGVKDMANLPVNSEKARLPLQVAEDNFSEFAGAIEQLQ